MKIYRIAKYEEKDVKWECPRTGISIVAHFVNQDADEYEIYNSEGNFVHKVSNFWHAKNWVKKHLNPDCEFPLYGVRI